MGEFTAAEIADRAGVEPAYVERLTQLGILVSAADPGFTVGDARRASIVWALERSGLPLEGLAEAIRRGLLSLEFADEPTYERFAAFTPETFRQASERSGVPVELLVVVREAMGSVEAQPDDRMRVDELEVVPFLQFMTRIGSSAAGVDRFLRVLGEGLRRGAETEAAWWRAEVVPRYGPSGPSPQQLHDILGIEDSDANDHAILALYRGQQANAWMKNIFEGFEEALM